MPKSRMAQFPRDQAGSNRLKSIWRVPNPTALDTPYNHFLYGKMIVKLRSLNEENKHVEEQNSLTIRTLKMA
jgi:hypothetical protein